jgi:16S rRNA (uracil1498-N3)-methyltransferase
MWDAYSCSFIKFTVRGFSAEVLKMLPTTELPVPVALAWGWAKGDKNDRIVRQATEIGCSMLQPVLFERAAAKKSVIEKRFARLETIAESAAAQAHRTRLALLKDPQAVSAFADSLVNVSENPVIVAWEEATAPTLSDVVDDVLGDETASVTLVIGPEGGLTAQEADALALQGAVLARLGSSILRVETACTVGLGIVADRIRSRYGT